MLPRHATSDADWARIQGLLPGRPGQAGRLAADNRLCGGAALRRAKAGAPRRDLPARFGPGNSVWRRFDRRAREGTWRPVPEALRGPDLGWPALDPTAIRARPCAAGAEKKATGPAGRPGRGWAAAGAASARRSPWP